MKTISFTQSPNDLEPTKRKVGESYVGERSLRVVNKIASPELAARAQRANVQGNHDQHLSFWEVDDFEENCPAKGSRQAVEGPSLNVLFELPPVELHKIPYLDAVEQISERRVSTPGVKQIDIDALPAALQETARLIKTSLGGPKELEGILTRDELSKAASGAFDGRFSLDSIRDMQVLKGYLPVPLHQVEEIAKFPSPKQERTILDDKGCTVKIRSDISYFAAPPRGAMGKTDPWERVLLPEVDKYTFVFEVPDGHTVVIKAVPDETRGAGINAMTTDHFEVVKESRGEPIEIDGEKFPRFASMWVQVFGNSGDMITNRRVQTQPPRFKRQMRAHNVTDEQTHGRHITHWESPDGQRFSGPRLMLEGPQTWAKGVHATGEQGFPVSRIRFHTLEP